MDKAANSSQTLTKPTHVPENDQERLSALRRYDILDTPPDGAFDRITELAAHLFDAPIALVSIVDQDRIWFKSRFGLGDVTEIPRDPGLCASAICQDGPYIINDAPSDIRALANPLVAGDFGLKFYAASPLKTHEGYNLGTLCILDRKPRPFSQAQAAMLETLAKVVIDHMELRLSALRTIGLERELRDHAKSEAQVLARLYEQERHVAETLQKALLPNILPKVSDLRLSGTYVAASTVSLIGGDWYDAFVVDKGRVLVAIGDVAGHGLDAAVTMARCRQSLRILAKSELTPSNLLRNLDIALADENAGTLVTLFVGIIDPATGVLRYSCAGHPPPLIRRRDGSIDFAEIGDEPLGLDASVTRHDKTMTLEPGSLLVLYTDGLTEATRDVIEGERSLIAAVKSLSLTEDDDLANVIRSSLLPNGSFDDLAVLTVARV